MKKIEGKLYFIDTLINDNQHIILGEYRGRHYITWEQQYHIEVDLLNKIRGTIGVSSKDI